MNPPTTDAWLLLACHLSANHRDCPGGMVAWLRLLEVADFLNHAIPTEAELAGAFDRLGRAGLLTVGDGPAVPTAAGRALVEACDSRSVRGQLTRLARRLEPGRLTEVADPVPFDTSGYGEALQQRRRF